MKIRLTKPKFKLKTYVAVAMGLSLGLITLILLVGLLGPESLLLKLSKNKSSVDISEIANQNLENAQLSSGQTEQVSEGAEQQADAQGQPTDTSTTTASGTETSSAGGTATSSGGTTAPATGGSTPASGGSTPAATVTPTLTFSGSPTTITTGASTVLSWSINSNATAPVTCTAGSGWSGAKSTSGSESKAPTSTTSYTLVCTNSAGSSGTKTVSVTVNPPAVVCNAGGTCTSSDISSHNTSGNCWVGVTGSGYNKVYVITSSFNSSHVSDNGKNAASAARTCGRVITINTLKGYAGNHSDGSKIGGSTFDSWMSSFYYANYQ
ncbi:hypothetical protein KBB49_04110 [Candidatus Saccharibacteria bacterium]|nr:hypothetical protein [Candidatus Saccharibacteria bacterium]